MGFYVGAVPAALPGLGWRGLGLSQETELLSARESQGMKSGTGLMGSMKLQLR